MHLGAPASSPVRPRNPSHASIPAVLRFRPPLSDADQTEASRHAGNAFHNAVLPRVALHAIDETMIDLQQVKPPLSGVDPRKVNPCQTNAGNRSNGHRSTDAGALQRKFATHRDNRVAVHGKHAEVLAVGVNSCVAHSIGMDH